MCANRGGPRFANLPLSARHPLCNTRVPSASRRARGGSNKAAASRAAYPEHLQPRGAQAGRQRGQGGPGPQLPRREEPGARGVLIPPVPLTPYGLGRVLSPRASVSPCQERHDRHPTVLPPKPVSPEAGVPRQRRGSGLESHSCHIPVSSLAPTKGAPGAAAGVGSLRPWVVMAERSRR